MSERSESKRIGAKQHKNSGRNNTKGDASWNNFVLDFKECSKSFTLNQDVWAKATTDALKKSMILLWLLCLARVHKRYDLL